MYKHNIKIYIYISLIILYNLYSLSFLERFLNVLCKKDVFSLTTDVVLHPAQVCYLDVLASFGPQFKLQIHSR